MTDLEKSPSKLAEKINALQNIHEMFVEVVRKEELEKLAKAGNIYAKHQQNVDRTGLGVNFEALMTKECSHIIESANGLGFEAHSTISTQRSDGFLIREKICTLCGKTLETKVWKPKPPRRRF